MKKKIIAYVVSAVMVLTMVPATAFAQVADGTTDSGISKTAPDRLKQAKEKAVTDLTARLLDYDSTNAKNVQGIIDEYAGEIEAVTAADDTATAISEAVAKVNELVAAANKEIADVKTAKEIIDDSYKSGNPDSTSGLYDKSKYYSTDNWEKIKGIKAEAIEALADVKTNEEVDTIITAAQAAIDAVPVATEDFATAKEEAIAAIEGYLDVAAYEGATYPAKIQGVYDLEVTHQIGYVNLTDTASELEAVAEVDEKGNLIGGSAKEALYDIINDNATSDQVIFIEALEDAITDDDRYGKKSDYDTYVGAFQGVLDTLGKGTTGDGYFKDFASYADDKNPTAYNEYRKDTKAVAASKAPTLENIERIISEIEDYVALIPTEKDEDAAAEDFIGAVGIADTKAELTSLLTQAKIMVACDPHGDWANISESVGIENYNTGTYEKDTLYGKVAAYNGAIKEEVSELVPGLPKIGDVNKYNYLDVLDRVAEIDALLGDQIDANGITGFNHWKNPTVYQASDIKNAADSGFNYSAHKTALTNKVYRIREVGENFINTVIKGVPTAKDMAEKDFVWDFASTVQPEGNGYGTGNVAAMNKATDQLENIVGQMKNDADIKVNDGGKDVTLSAAIDQYNTALTSIKAAQAQIDVAEDLCGRIPTVIKATDKDTIDAAWDAYKALPEVYLVGYGTFIIGEFIGYRYTDSIEGAVTRLVRVYVDSVDEAMEDAQVDNWSDLTASFIDQYDAIEDMNKDYGRNVYNPLEYCVSEYNSSISNPDDPRASEGAASEVAKIIKDIPNDPDEDLTESDIAAVKKARAEYDALLTDEAKTEFKRAGYLKQLEDYEAAIGIVEADYDLANATVTILGPSIEGGLPYVARGTTPEVEVTDANGNEVPATAYTVDCNEAHPAGKTSLIIRANDGSGYTGENEAAYVVVNNKKSIKSLKGAKKSFTVKYSDYSKHGCTGTEIQWRTANGEWKYKKITSNKASKKITVKAAGKKYVKVRAIVKVDGVRYYGEWSKAKAVTVK